MTFSFLFTIVLVSVVNGGCDLNIVCHVKEGIKKGIKIGEDALFDKLLGSLGDAVEGALEPVFLLLPGDVKDVLDEPLDSITKFVDEIPEIGENAFNILEITKDLVSIFKEGPFNLEDVGDKNFANTLKNCMTQFTDIVNPLKAFEEIIEIKEFNFMPPMPDIEDMTYKILALGLVKMKRMIEWTCTEIVPELIEFTKNMLEGSMVRRRLAERSRPRDATSKQWCKKLSFPIYFMPEEDNCATIPAERFCESPNDEYFFDSLDPDGGDVYASMVEFYSPRRCDSNGKSVDAENRLLQGPYENSNTEVYHRFRVARFLFQLINHVVEVACGIFDGCVQDTKKCPAAPVCAAAKAVTYNINTIFDFILGNADLHDGEVNNMRLKTIFKDRITIIHNQQAILSTIQKGILGITTNVEAAEDANKYTLKKVIDAIDTLQENFESFDEQYSGGKTERIMKIDGMVMENHEEVAISMKIKPTDLYVLYTVFGVCNFVFMIIGMVIMRYCVGYNSFLKDVKRQN